MPPLFCREEEALKTINLLIYGYESAPVAIGITPEFTAQDLLTKAGLEECDLVRMSEPQKFFQREEPLYGQLTDGDALYAVLPSGD